MTALQLLADNCNVRDALPVLISAPLRPGFDRAHISRYGDPVWDLAPGVFRDNARRCHITVHFDGIDDPSIADALRQILHARLNVDLPGHRSRLEPAGVRGEGAPYAVDTLPYPTTTPWKPLLHFGAHHFLSAATAFPVDARSKIDPGQE